MKPVGVLQPKSKYILGVDIARTGADETAYIIIEQPSFTDECFVIYAFAEHTPTLTQVIGRVINLHNYFNFTKIYIDETGLGSGVGDVLKSEIGYVVEGIMFTMKSKADMFNNLKLLFQQKKLIIPDYTQAENSIWKKLYFQLLSINYEFNKTGNLLISHKERSHDDLVCALALAGLYFSSKKGNRGYYLVGV